jgi:hypothetical protein
MQKRSSDPPGSTRLSFDIPISRISRVDPTRLGDQPRFSKSNLPAHGEVSESDLDPDIVKVCDICELPTPPIWNCSYCDTDFCDSCWGKQGPHRPGKKGPDGLPHEKANPDVVRRLKDILTPPTSHSEQQLLHIADEDTTWFGLTKDKDNQSMFEDYGRYSTIMADSNNGEHRSRYPQLVSFIGQTGAGKSTIIKMLIDQQQSLRSTHSRETEFPSPVVGSVTNGNVPTSGDVHLYSDPCTYEAEYPMLFADCEGLEGGENTPISAQYRETVSAGSEEKGKDKDKRGQGKPNKVTKVLNGPRRLLQWANSPEKSKRQHAVTELYPRLLYTFSDVIVFVLRNAKYVKCSLPRKLHTYIIPTKSFF